MYGAILGTLVSVAGQDETTLSIGAVQGQVGRRHALNIGRKQSTVKSSSVYGFRHTQCVESYSPGRSVLFFIKHIFQNQGSF